MASVGDLGGEISPPEPMQRHERCQKPLLGLPCSTSAWLGSSFPLPWPFPDIQDLGTESPKVTGTRAHLQFWVTSLACVVLKAEIIWALSCTFQAGHAVSRRGDLVQKKQISREDGSSKTSLAAGERCRNSGMWKGNAGDALSAPGTRAVLQQQERQDRSCRAGAEPARGMLSISCTW